MAGRGAYQKKAQNIANVRARHDLLIEGINSPKRMEKCVHAALVGQRAFAALDLPKQGITPIALNTIKSLSDEIFTSPDGDGQTGFAYLDGLRVRLRQSLSRAAVTRTVEAKAERVAEAMEQLEARRAAAEAQSVKRQKAYLSLYATINGLIKSGDLQPEAQERLYRALENHHAAFSELFAPNPPSTRSDDSSVTHLSGMGKAK